MENSNNTPQTFWQQLQAGGLNAFLFYTLLAIILVSGLLSVITDSLSAPYVFGGALLIQAVNVGATLFSKEKKQRRQ